MGFKSSAASGWGYSDNTSWILEIWGRGVNEGNIDEKYWPKGGKEEGGGGVKLENL